MPISSFYGLQTSLRGLLAQQRALDVTGHNISNASTVGYSRQEAVMVAAPALEIPAGATTSGAGAHLGAGVDVGSYRRVRDTFLDLQYRAQATRLGEEAGKAEGLDRAELALAEPSESGVSTQLSRFWSSWSDLQNAPENPAARQALVEQAKTLAEAFASVDDQLELVRTQARAEYDTLTAANGEVHGMAREIADLNATIRKFVTAGDQPSDLMDRRDLLLDKLSDLGQVNVVELNTGSIRVTFGGPSDPPLVDDSTVNWPPALSAPSGRLGALRDLAAQPGGQIQGYRDRLDQVAAQVVSSVNALHTAAGRPPFFSATAGSEASTLAVAVSVANVRASGTAAAGANELAAAVAGLRDGAADNTYRAFVASIGTEVRESKRQEANARVLSEAVDDRRQSVAGVALDEEMSNLVRFQRSYQASARAMSTMDEMLDVLINRTGRVGL